MPATLCARASWAAYPPGAGRTTTTTTTLRAQVTADGIPCLRNNEELRQGQSAVRAQLGGRAGPGRRGPSRSFILCGARSRGERVGRRALTRPRPRPDLPSSACVGADREQAKRRRDSYAKHSVAQRSVRSESGDTAPTRIRQIWRTPAAARRSLRRGLVTHGHVWHGWRRQATRCGPRPSA